MSNEKISRRNLSAESSRIVMQYNKDRHIYTIPKIEANANIDGDL